MAILQRKTFETPPHRVALFVTCMVDMMYPEVGLATVELPIPVGRYPQARYSLVELVPHTGRLHQLRKHLAHLRHPIVGDVRHGEGRHNRLFREHLGIRRLLLHAWWLALPHPHHDRPLRIRAPLDDELRGLLQRLGWAEAGLTCDRSPPGSLPSASSAT